ncbi:MAG: replication factor C large subunit [Candidatus Pacearchaeota archaeon]|nr:replication factor C large subunit [Candidatus Pacearchaeota archaeon]
MLPFTEKYKPTYDEIACSQESKSALKKFILEFQKQNKKAALLFGPSGCGKTSSVYALASQLNYEVIELNASDFRNKQNISEIIGKVSQQHSLFSRGKIVLIDELEGISGDKDKGGIPEVVRLIETTSWPIILIANDAWQEKLRPLRSKILLIEFKKCDKNGVAKALAKIASREKIQASLDVLESIAIINDCDIRASINDLQILSTLKRPLTKLDVASLHIREKDESVFKALQTILKSKATRNIFDNVQNMNEDDLFLWLDENIPREYKGEELVKAYDALSKADVFRGRIRKWQYWRFLVYVLDLLTCGVSNAKEKSHNGFTSYKPPSRILKIWLAKQKQLKKISISEKLAKATHSSKKVARQELDYLKIFFNTKQKIQAFSKELNLEPEETEWLKAR